MKQKVQLIFTAIAVLAAATFTTGFTSNIYGGDHYRILLNNRILMEHYVGQPKKDQTILLNKANANDQLVIHYSHCGLAGKNREVALKTANGIIVKKWRYEDAGSTGMRLAVKDVLNVISNNEAMIVYSSKEISKGIALATIQSNTAVVRK